MKVMITKELIEDVTQVYLHSYTVALNETRNPNLAVQCATGVTMVLANMVRQKPQNDPMGMLFAVCCNDVRDGTAVTGNEETATKTERT